MGAAPRQVLIAQIPSPQRGEVRLAEARELLEQLGQRFAGALSRLGEAIVAVEGPRLALLEDDASPHDPVGLLAVDEMADDIVGAEGVGALVGAGPFVGKRFEPRCQGRGRPFQQGDGAVEGEHAIPLLHGLAPGSGTTVECPELR